MILFVHCGHAKIRVDFMRYLFGDGEWRIKANRTAKYLFD
jgi:hypothetical protein|nr:MAG TPA: hypothetical protein [Caudoviricetes sp.]